MTTEKRQTPLQKLIGKLKHSIKLYEESGSPDKFSSRIDDLKDIIKEAESLLPEERQVVIDGFDKGFENGMSGYTATGEQYFNETYL
jgi:hypothetical protein